MAYQDNFDRFAEQAKRAAEQISRAAEQYNVMQSQATRLLESYKSMRPELEREMKNYREISLEAQRKIAEAASAVSDFSKKYNEQAQTLLKIYAAQNRAMQTWAKARKQVWDEVGKYALSSNFTAQQAVSARAKLAVASTTRIQMDDAFDTKIGEYLESVPEGYEVEITIDDNGDAELELKESCDNNVSNVDNGHHLDVPEQQNIDRDVSCKFPSQRTAEFLVCFFLEKEISESMLGDIEQDYDRDCVRFGKNAAQSLYWKRILESLWPIIKNYFLKIMCLSSAMDFLKKHLLG